MLKSICELSAVSMLKAIKYCNIYTIHDIVHPVDLRRALNYFVSLYGKRGKRGGKKRVKSLVLICDPRTDYRV